MPISLAHKLARRLTEVRKSGMLHVSASGRQEPGDGRVRRGQQPGARGYRRHLHPAQPGGFAPADPRGYDRNRSSSTLSRPSCSTRTPSIFINPTGRFVIGGPQGDSGLTGRKIIVDTYGGIGRHGGGAFSGKDPTKVDRSGAYAARWVAKNIVAAGLAKRCEIQLAYAIGVAEPVSIMVETFGTGIVDDSVIEQAIEHVFDLRPAAIIEQLDLRKPIYKQLAAYGHMGREELGVKWENRDKAEALKAYINK